MPEKYYLLSNYVTGIEYIVAGPFETWAAAENATYDYDHLGVYVGLMTEKIAKDKYGHTPK